uniref:Uncharacterized protein n=1 Tax=Anguilla anguilla TaxID=7936 RepID=A0A0E9XKF3_ANGAN
MLLPDICNCLKENRGSSGILTLSFKNIIKGRFSPGRLHVARCDHHAFPPEFRKHFNKESLPWTPWFSSWQSRETNLSADTAHMNSAYNTTDRIQMTDAIFLLNASEFK